MHNFEGKSYSVAGDIILDDGAIPLTWWTVTPNFGDLLSPYLIRKITSMPVKLVRLIPALIRKSGFLSFRKTELSYFAIGSIIRRTNSRSIVWGSGTFGTEGAGDFNKDTKYLAVRGPLTRNLLRIHGIGCPEIYGDPALLFPEIFNPVVQKKYRVGVILRWSETEWNNADFDRGIKKIDMSSTQIHKGK